ncbi:ras-related protein Rab-24-like [Copidosoma floridanum]|uniref:ras-related protein Rab-24-like n=1 Tax=Copidosoma floridanum TaxID=29053 RepID=UPI000C6F521C|nr:ras-related protein Rab-24-like [Copidosoma floridanum]
MTAIGTRENIKVVLLGESSTGKTCLMNRYFKNAYSESERETIGAAFHSKVLQVKNVEYRLNCWDTSGQERFRSVCSLYYHDAKAAILCYDVRSWKNFLKLDYWANELMRYQPDRLIYLCATKADLLDEFETIPKYEVIQSYAREWNAKFFVTSAGTVAVDQAYSTEVKLSDLFTVKANFKALLYTCAAVSFQQLTGINVVLFYAQTIFKDTGSSLPPAISTIIIGVVQVGASAVTPVVVDRMGRRTLLLASGVGTAIGTMQMSCNVALRVGLVIYGA